MPKGTDAGGSARRRNRVSIDQVCREHVYDAEETHRSAVYSSRCLCSRQLQAPFVFDVLSNASHTSSTLPQMQNRCLLRCLQTEGITESQMFV